jgi:NADH-quinone oxidoreductase subunit M
VGADVTGLPILSVMTWAPFIAALIVMGFARHQPLLVRWMSLLGATVSLAASLWVYWAYNRDTAGFQFQEQFDLVPSLGITYHFAVDGMSVLMCLLTSIIIFAGVFASWTVKERSQEFYALLLLLVTGVYGVFVSLDLFVFFLFYEIAVLPMYLLIGIWGSSGEVRPQGIFGWAFGRTGVGTKEYAAMKLTLYLLFGSAFILVGILALYVAGGRSFSFVTLQSMRFDPTVQSWVFLAFYI